MTMEERYALFGCKDGRQQFLDRSLLLSRLMKRAELETENGFEQFDIVKSNSQESIKGIVRKSGYIDWIKVPGGDL